MTFSQRYILHIFLFSSLFVAPAFVHAQSVSLTAEKTTYAVNDGVLMKATVQTGGRSINAVEGQISFPPSSLSISDIRYGNSIISLWVKNPTLDASAGTITFTGGIPGGFNGSTGNLFTFVVRPKKEGTLTIGLNDVKILLNDESGEEMTGLKVIPFTAEITKATKATPLPVSIDPVSGKPVESTSENSVNPTNSVTQDIPFGEDFVSVPDTIPPEDFVPMVSRHESVADGSYFVAFFAVDKDSGVLRYEVREQPRILSLFTDKFGTQWKETRSPHILAFQSWGSIVEVRATDAAGNSTVSKTVKPFGLIIVIIFISFLFLSAVILIRIFRKRSVPTRDFLYKTPVT
jgi:hypothetical protein